MKIRNHKHYLVIKFLTELLHIDIKGNKLELAILHSLLYRGNNHIFIKSLQHQQQIYKTHSLWSIVDLLNRTRRIP